MLERKKGEIECDWRGRMTRALMYGTDINNIRDEQNNV
jgi:hypothetical protein